MKGPMGWVVVAAVVGVATAARADGDAAKRALDEGRYDEAATLLEAEYQADPSPKLALRTALALERGGHCDLAIPYFETYLAALAGRDATEQVVAMQQKVLAHLDACRAAVAPDSTRVEVAETTHEERYGTEMALWSLLLLPVGGPFLADPLIHLRHGNVRGAVRSVAVFAGILIPTFVVAASVSRGCDGRYECALDPLLPMMAGGLVEMIAVGVDWGMWAHVSKVTVTPTVATTGDGAVIGLSGSW